MQLLPLLGTRMWQQERAYYSSLVHRRGDGSTLWSSRIARRPPRARVRFVRERALRPVIAYHVAAMALQRMARGVALRLRLSKSSEMRVPVACRRTAAAALARRTAHEAAGGKPHLSARDAEARTASRQQRDSRAADRQSIRDKYGLR